MQDPAVAALVAKQCEARQEQQQQALAQHKAQSEASGAAGGGQEIPVEVEGGLAATVQLGSLQGIGHHADDDASTDPALEVEVKRGEAEEDEGLLQGGARNAEGSEAVALPDGGVRQRGADLLLRLLRLIPVDALVQSVEKEQALRLFVQPPRTPRAKKWGKDPSYLMHEDKRMEIASVQLASEAVYRVLADLCRHSVLPEDDPRPHNSIHAAMRALASMLCKAAGNRGWNGVATVPCEGGSSSMEGGSKVGRWDQLRWRQPAIVLSLLLKGSDAERLRTALLLLLQPTQASEALATCVSTVCHVAL